MRHQEVHGYYPYLKEFTEKRQQKKAAKEEAKRQKQLEKETAESPGSSGIFETGKNSTEKVMEEVRTVPARTLSD